MTRPQNHRVKASGRHVAQPSTPNTAANGRVTKTPNRPFGCAAVALCFMLAGMPGAHAASSLASLIQSGDRAAALKEIAAGADVNAAQGDGTTPLIWAVYKVDAEL